MESQNDQDKDSNNNSALGIVKKTWKWFWHSDSILSWAIQMVVAFILIKYLLYPGLGVVFHTSFPIVAVVSGSMEHRIVSSEEIPMPNICGLGYSTKDYYLNIDEFWAYCGKWYEEPEIGISKEDFSNFTFLNGFNKGDIIFIYGTEPKNLKIGDVIVFSANGRPYPIIHRVVKIDVVNDEYYYTTKGDHNSNIGPFDMKISEKQILGKATFLVPWLGYAKIWFTDLISLIRGN